MPTPQFVTFSYPDDSNIPDSSVYSIYQQLETDVNSSITAQYQANLDNVKWNLLSLEIANLVHEANTPGINANEKSLIYGQIMIIITAQYLPVVSDFLGDEIAQQAATENIASDVSSMILEAQNAFNSLLALGSDGTATQPTTYPTSTEEQLFSGVMSLTGNDGASSGVSGTAFEGIYDYSFTVNYTSFEADGTINPGTQQLPESSILSMLTDTTLWGSSSTTPLSTSESSQINTGLTGVISTFNAGIVIGSNWDGSSSSTATITPDAAVYANSWYSADTANVTDSGAGNYLNPLTYMSVDWMAPYGNASLEPGNYGSGNAPLVYTMPNTIQQDLNQAAQAVETVSNSTQTVENFQVQEIDQFYGITNSIQQSQQQQCATIVGNFKT